MKFFLSLLITFILLGSFYAYGKEKDQVIDELSYLSDSEIEDLEDSIDQIADDCKLDVVIMITDDTEGKSSMAFADDYFDYNGYGIGSERSGLMMLINMAEREVWISTTGDAIDIFTNSRIDKMVDHVVEYLSGDRYDKASAQFLKDINKYAKPLSYFERIIRNITSPILYIVLLVISLLATLIAGFASKSKMTVSNRTYENPNAFVLHEQRDAFIREHQTRVKVVKSTGGGSSTHRGSSGRSHGGGGGHF